MDDLQDWTNVFIRWFTEGDGYQTEAAVFAVAQDKLPSTVIADNPAVAQIVAKCKEIQRQIDEAQAETVAHALPLSTGF